MNITLLITSLVAMVFAWCFLLAAVFTFAAHDQKPLDRDTQRLLSLDAWFGGGRFAYIYAVVGNWRHCQQARRFFYVGLAFCVITLALGGFALR